MTMESENIMPSTDAVSNPPDFPEGCAIVFGGSGGLGQAICLALARQGTPVVVTYRSGADKAGAVVAKIKQAGGVAYAKQCDVADVSSIKALCADAKATCGRIHTVVTAYGASYQARSFMDSTAEKYRSMMEADVFNFFNVAQVVIPHLRGGGGSIVAITATTVRRAVPHQTESITPKLALTGLCTQIALEEGVNGIRVNTVGPGVIEAGMALTMMESGNREFLEHAVAVTPMRRMGSADELAQAVVFLASRRASFITGQHLMVDGGLTAG